MDKKGRSMLIFGGIFIFLVLILGVFIFADSGNVKSYDAETKTATIKNSLNNEIADITLNTPIVYKVIRGKDRLVAEYTLNSYEDYSDAFGKLEFYDVKNNLETFERRFSYRYKTFYDIEVGDYETVCEERVLTNSSIEEYDCVQNKTGSHIEQRYQWNEFNENNLLPQGEITIGIFTDVLANERVEWVPTLFGVEINEWAEWVESLNVDLQGYYTLNESSGNALDSVGSNDGVLITTNNITQGGGGLIGTSYNFTGGYVDTVNAFDYGGGNLTISMWADVTLGQYHHLVGKYIDTSSWDGWALRITNGNDIEFCLDGCSTHHFTRSLTQISSGWNHIVLVINGDNTVNSTKLYINGSEVAYDPLTSLPANAIGWLDWTSNTHNFTFGDVMLANFLPTNGFVDEIGIWNRTLSSEEISNLWNGGTGITYGNPLVNIIFNVTDSYSSAYLNNVDINCNSTDFNQSGDTTNTYGAYGFLPGNYECEFEKILYFDKSITFTADVDKTIEVRMSEMGGLTYEEHTWLEALYNCIILEDCSLYNLLISINNTVNNIWEQTAPTDESVVASEIITNKVVDASNNLTIDYTINIPTKAGYSPGAYLPIRIGYWFLDDTNTTCYNQGEQPMGVEGPYCQPLIVETIGPMGGSVDFIVELQPALVSGSNYSIKRIIDIDPLGVWYNYGSEVISDLTMIETLSTYGASTTTTGESMPETQTTTTTSSSGGSRGGDTTNVYNTYNIEQYPSDDEGSHLEEEQEEIVGNKEVGRSWLTGGVIGTKLLMGNGLIFITAMLCGTFIIFIIVRRHQIPKSKEN